MTDPNRRPSAFATPLLRSVGVPVMAAGLLLATGAGCSMCASEDGAAADDAGTARSQKAAKAEDAGEGAEDDKKGNKGKKGNKARRRRSPKAKAKTRRRTTRKPKLARRATRKPDKAPTLGGKKLAGKGIPKPSKIADLAKMNKKGGDDKKDPKGRADEDKDEMNFAEEEVEGPGFTLDKAFNRAVVRRATGYRGFLRKSDLVGVDPAQDYNAVRLRPTTPNRFGVGLQVWRIDNPGKQTRRFNDLYRQYPESRRTRELGDSAFTAEWDGMRYVVWLERKEEFLAVVSCDESVCAADDKVLKLAQEVGERLPKELK